MTKRTGVLALTALLFAMAAFQIRAEPVVGLGGHGYRDLSPAEVKDLLVREDPFLLDVHVPNEGYLAGTDARIPYTEVADRELELPSDPDALIVVYCMIGRMSEIAAGELVRLGYRNIVNLDGGMLAWQAAGYEVLPD